MIVRKLNPGDARGIIAEVENIIIQRWDLKSLFFLTLRLKHQDPDTTAGDSATIFEVLPLGTPLTTWSDNEYRNWIDIHDRHTWDKNKKTNYCPECGSIGSIVRDKLGKYTKFRDGRPF